MTLPSRKKRPTTPRSTPRTTSAGRGLALAALVSLIANPAAALDRARARVIHDDQVVVAAWEEADADQGPELPDVEYVADGRSVVVKRSTLAHEVPARPDRLAQLPNDPFETDEAQAVEEEALPEPDDEFGAAQDAVETEIDRRQDTGNHDYDVFEDPAVSQPSQETLEGESPLDTTEPDATPTVEDDDASLEPADTRLFDEMTTDDQPGDEQPADESMQYGSDDLDLAQPPTEEMNEAARRVLEEERLQNTESCQEELDKLRAQTLESIDLSIRVPGNAGEDYPFECTLEGDELAPRHWPQITYMWKASGLCHKPLYFEQVALERYGHTWGPYTQPIMSGIHFFGTLPILPYKMGLQTPNECVYSLGYYRPGSCAPYLVGGVPFTWRAAGYQTGVVTGLNFIIP